MNIGQWPDVVQKVFNAMEKGCSFALAIRGRHR